jgi:hypothetical protein
MTWLLIIAGVMLVGMIGFLVEVALLRVTGGRWSLVVGFGLGSMAWLAHCLGLHRRWPISWLIGTQAVTLLYGIAYAASGITRVLH